jgi:ABC-type sugar transport system permease subunit
VSAPLARTARGYAWAAPATILVVGVVYYSILYTAQVSTWDWDGLSPNPVDVGLANYERLLRDQIFWAAMRNAVVFAAVSIPLSMAVGLLFAVLLHSQIRGRAIYSAIIFVPVVLSLAVLGPVLRQSVAPGGEIDTLLSTLGLGFLYRPWLSDPANALWVLVAFQVWSTAGFAFILYYAGITQLDEDVFEAARLEGAGPWSLTRWITIPQLHGTHAVLVILGAIGALKVFDLPWVVTQGGPARATEFPGTYIYKQTITSFNAGYGAAVSMVTVVLAIGMAVFLFARRQRSLRVSR